MFLLTKLMGYRQMSQMSMFDYVVGITIGSIGAEVATNVDGDAWIGLCAMAVYAIATLLIGYVNRHSLLLRSLLLGKVLVLYDNGHIDYNHLKKAKMDLNELMLACRNAGYFDLQKLSLILLEVNGQLSFLPKEAHRPLLVGDVRTQTQSQERPTVAVIIDGKVCKPSLQSTGKTEDWLIKAIKAQGMGDKSTVLLATIDASDHVRIYLREENHQSKSYYV